MLAEVSDKIPSIGFFWFFHLAAAAVVLVLTHLSQRRAALVLLLPLALAWAAFFAHDALFAKDPLRNDVRQEVGAGYYTQQALAALLPAAAVVGLAGPVPWFYHSLRARRRRRDGLCPACGYNLAGNVTGVCPECGNGGAP